MTALGDDPLAAARLLHDLGRFELAVEAARRVLAERPDDPEAHSLVALALAGRGHQLAQAGAKGEAARLAGLAEGAAREAVGLDPEAGGAWLALASVLGWREGGDAAAGRAEAIAVAGTALRLDPGPGPLVMLAHLRLAELDAAGALDLAEDALGIDPGSAGAGHARAQALALLGRDPDGAAASAQLELHPEDAGAWGTRGFAALQAGAWDEAVAALEEAQRLDPTDQWIARTLHLARQAGHGSAPAALPARLSLLASRLLAGAKGPAGHLAVLAAIGLIALLGAVALLGAELATAILVPGLAPLVVLAHALLFDAGLRAAVSALDVRRPSVQASAAMPSTGGRRRRRLGPMAPLGPSELAASTWAGAGLAVVLAGTALGFLLPALLPLTLAVVVLTAAGAGAVGAGPGRARTVGFVLAGLLAAAGAAGAALAVLAGAGRREGAGVALLVVTCFLSAVGLELLPGLAGNLAAERRGELVLASLPERAAALAIDLGLQLALAVVVAGVTAAALALAGRPPAPRPGLAGDALLAGALPQLPLSLWNLGLRHGPHGGGRSLGKRLLGLRLVTRRDGRAPSQRVAWVRWALRLMVLFGCYLGSLGWLWPLWDRDRQTLEDKLLGLVVVREPA